MMLGQGMPDRMSAAPVSLASWLVSAHPRGEVLTIEERGPSLVLWLLGQPEGFSVPEIQGWLHDVSGVAHESAALDTSPQPIPVLLRHALSGLLFSHAEMWARGEGPGPCSVAFTSGPDGIGLGWVGDAEATVWLDSQPCDVRWVRVRDDQGREARAWSVEAGHDVRVTLRWQLRPGDADSPRVLLEARTRTETADAGPVVAAPRFVPPARRAVSPQTPGPIAESIAAAFADQPIAPAPPEFAPPDPVIEEESLSLAGPSVEALYDVDPPAHASLAIESVLAQDVRDEPAPAMMSPAAIDDLPEIAQTVAIPDPPSVEVVEVEEEASYIAPAEAVLVPRVSSMPPETRKDLDSGKPSSGIARWLSKNFSWMRRSRAEEPERAATPMPVAQESSEPVSEQQEMPGLIALPMQDETPPLEVRGVMDAADPVVADLPARDHEDELARTAAALAEALGGWDAPAVEVPAVEVPAAPPEVVTEPERIFDVLPDQIPPTPESAELTARATSVVDTDADLHAVALPDPEPIPDLDPPVTGPPAALPVMAPSRPPRLPSFVKPPVARPDSDARLEDNLHSRLDLAPVFAPPPGQVFDPHERTIEPVPLEAITPESTPLADLESAAASVESPGATTSVPSGDAPASVVPDDWTPSPEAALEAANRARAREASAPPRRRTALHPDWPSENDVQAETRRTRTTWIALGAIVAVLFGVGWLVGSLQGARHSNGPAPKGVLAMFGVKGPTFKTEVKSQPDGAWILVDGKATNQRTPVTLELPPGKHEVTLSFGEWGQAVYPVAGKKRETHHVDGTLWGSLDVAAPELGSVIAVAVDGRPRGFAPVRVDSLAPGPHQLRFSGPGMPSWGQTVEIRVAQRQEVLPRALSSPATGVLQVRANVTEAGETESLSGARVWIDGELNGTTPLTVELSRGPHSVRVERGDDRPPIQVIDLPGGNQRFATFELGTGAEHPVLRLDAPDRVQSDRAAVISATLTEVAPREVKEMWLHVLGPDGAWSRYPMARLQGQLSAVGAIAFPVAQIGPSGRTRYYVSAVTTQGDEFFTELQTMTEHRPPR